MPPTRTQIFDADVSTTIIPSVGFVTSLSVGVPAFVRWHIAPPTKMFRGADVLGLDPMSSELCGLKNNFARAVNVFDVFDCSRPPKVATSLAAIFKSSTSPLLPAFRPEICVLFDNRIAPALAGDAPSDNDVDSVRLVRDGVALHAGATPTPPGTSTEPTATLANLLSAFVADA